MEGYIVLMVIIIQSQAIKIDINKLCQPRYGIKGFRNQVGKIEGAKQAWENFKGVQGVEGQVGTFESRPVFKMSGNTLAEHLRECAKRKGAPVEFITAEQQVEVNTLMRKLKLDKILLHMAYTNQQLTWHRSGAPFQYELLDEYVKNNKANFRGMIQYKSFDKSTKEEKNEFSVVNAPSNLKSLCVANENTLYQEIERFGYEIEQETGLLAQISPTIRELEENITIEIEKAEGNRSRLEGEKCWPIMISPMQETIYKLPPRIDNYPKLLKAIKMFQAFKEKYRETQKKMVEIKKDLGSSPSVGIEIHTLGMSFFRTLNLETWIGKLVFTLMMTITTTIPVIVCYCLIFFCIIGRQRNPQYHQRNNRYRPVEQVPLALRRD